MATPDAKSLQGNPLNLGTLSEGDLLRYDGADIVNTPAAPGVDEVWSWNGVDGTQFDSVVTGTFGATAPAGTVALTTAAVDNRLRVQLQADASTAGYHVFPVNDLTLANRLLLQWQWAPNGGALEWAIMMIGDSTMQNGLIFAKDIKSSASSLTVFGVTGGTADTGDSADFIPFGLTLFAAPDVRTKALGGWNDLRIDINSQGATPFLWMLSGEEFGYQSQNKSVANETTAAEETTGGFPSLDGLTLDTIGFGVAAEVAPGAAINVNLHGLRGLRG